MTQIEEPDGFWYVFCCPNCGEHELEEVLVDTVVTSLTKVRVDGDHKFGKLLSEDDEVEQYRCVSCGWAVAGEDGHTLTDGTVLAESLGFSSNKA